jgi:ABC-type lipoprotein export system ATPase subunit
MKLHSISAQNFMSLHSFEMSDLDPQVNFVVGPNGAGKTTLFRALTALQEGFRVASQTNPYSGASPAREQFLATMRRRATQGVEGVNPSEIEIASGVTLDSERERDLFTAFLATALTTRDQLQQAASRGRPNRNLSDEGIAAISAWLLNALRNANLHWLLRGTLRVRCWLGAYDPRLLVGYTVECGGSPITFSAGWQPAYNIGQVSQGELHPGEPPVRPAEEALFQHLNDTNTEVCERVLDVLTGADADLSSMSLDPLPLVRYLASEKAQLVASGAYQYPYPPAHQSLTALTGMSLRDRQNERVSIAAVFSQFLSEGLVIARNVRAPLPPAQIYTVQEFMNVNPTIEDESHLPLRLFWLKNRETASTERFDRIQTTFQQFVGAHKRFDVVARRLDEEANRFVPQGALLQWMPTEQENETSQAQPGDPSQAPQVRLEITLADQRRESLLADEGAGMWEVLILSALIHDSDGRIVLLDEPASNMHPGMQRRIRERLRSVAGQLLVVTHSQHLLPTRASEFTKVARLSKPGAYTVLHRLPVAGVKGLEPDKLEQELSTSSDVGGLLFASGVILVEGDTETAALSEWFPRIATSGGTTLDDLGVALYAVGGKNDFGFFIRFLHAFGVPWAVIADGDALVSNPSLWNALRDAGAASASPAAPADFAEVRRNVAAVGVFTANDSPSADFELIPEVDAYIKDPAYRLPTRSKVRDGRQIGRNIPCPPSVEEVLCQVMARFRALGVQMPTTTTA